jgi:YjjG family noncanonical pyrimidine nucleotidase
MAKENMMKEKNTSRKYSCVFFDLDHTLWDYEKNSKETLGELYADYALASKGVTDEESFYRQFRKVNNELWDLYDRELIDHSFIRQERFKRILEKFSAYETKLSEDLSRDYLTRCPQKNNLIPYAEEVLAYLTNGFEAIQNIKLAAGKIDRYFQHIVTSQKAGHRKPSRKIFDYALDANKIQCCDVIMIGDNLATDMAGARGCTIDTVFFNPDKVKHDAHVDHEISCLSELKNIL